MDTTTAARHVFPPFLRDFIPAVDAVDCSRPLGGGCLFLCCQCLLEKLVAALIGDINIIHGPIL